MHRRPLDVKSDAFHFLWKTGDPATWPRQIDAPVAIADFD